MTYVQPIASYLCIKGSDFMEGQNEIRTFTYPNAIVRVHFPDLTAEEQKRRMKYIYKAAEALLKEKIRNETNK